MIKTALLLTFLFFLNSFAYGQDTTFGDMDHWGFCFDLDLVYSGSPEAAVSISGSDAAIATASGDVQKENNDLQESLDDFEWWPVMSAGLVYQF
ncbi:MAG: hypothetical protein VXX20_11605 [Verrucomicrobiota bacterium]|nr:hypothetical protein [Verrucomicrobiota bacterium]